MIKPDFIRNGKGHDHCQRAAEIFMGWSHGTCELSTHLITYPSSRITDAICSWDQQKPNVSHLWEFGCDVWILDESINRLKLDPWSKKMIFIGFMDGSKAVWYYDAKNRSIKVSRNVTFNEDEELRALDIIEVPSIQLEGEIISPATQQPAPVPKTPQPETPEPRQLWKTGFIDYSKLNDPGTHHLHKKLHRNLWPQTDPQNYQEPNRKKNQI